MAYGEKYLIPFKNREQTNCEVRILEKDYTYPSIELTGSERPFTLSAQSQDNQIPYGIKATEVVIEFFAGSLRLEDFYTEDDTNWRVDFYYNSVLAWTGFLQLDNCYDILQDTDHILSLNANDGLASLQNIQLLDGNGLPVNLSWPFTTLLADIFGNTGLQIDVQAWLNIYENSTDDRTVTDYLTFLSQTTIPTKYYINDDGTTQTLYDILNNFLIDFRACLFQANGVWNIIRWGDVRLFGDGLCPGTLYNSGFSTYSEIFLPAAVSVGRGLSVSPINENQQSRILRPFQYVKETFNYNQPPSISQADLQIEEGAVPFATNTAGGLRFDDYSLATYFPLWKQRNGDDSYLEIVTDISVSPETEIERYIVTPATGTDNKGVEFDAIPVTKGDSFDFSLQFRTDTAVGTDIVFRVRFLLILADNTAQSLDRLTVPIRLEWSAPFAVAGFDSADAIPITEDSTYDSSEYFTWDSGLYHFFSNGSDLGHIIVIPEDGMLLIQVMATNSGSFTGHQTTFWNSIELTLTAYINKVLTITGQFHKNSLLPDIKNNEEYDVTQDDSPSNAITGTLFTDALTTFGANIGTVNFTKTSAWHRSNISEARRLGDLNTDNDLFIQRKIRTILDGDFFGLTGISLLTIINWSEYPDKNFIFGISTINYMACIWNASLYELWETGEGDGGNLDANAKVTNYNGISTALPLVFDDVVTAVDWAPDINFVIFTFSGPDTAATITLNIVGTWNVATAAAVDLKVNGVVVGTSAISMGGVSVTLIFNTTLFTGDTVSASVDWIGAITYDLDVDSGYLRVESNIGNNYLFNYIYDNG